MTDVIDRLNYDRWVSHLVMEQAMLDVRRAEEWIAEEVILDHARELGLELWHLLDVCFHDWYDMENPEHFRRLYGEIAHAGHEHPPLPPARWLLRSAWMLRQRGIDKLSKASQDA
jgi:hypothetical protein